MREADNVGAFARRAKAGRSMRRRYLGKMLVAAVCALGGWLLAGVAQEAKPKAVVVPDTAKGFDKQYKQFFKDYQKAKKGEREKVFVQFAIPEHWFTDTFGKERAAEYVKAYIPQLDDFVSATANRLTGTAPCPDCAVNLETKLSYSVALTVPGLTLPPAQRFEIHYQSLSFIDRMNPQVFVDLAWMDSFIYVDGAFRFYGKGAGSFFDPVRVRLADPCSPNGEQLGGKVIHRVEPVYPEEAKAKQPKGFVKMIVTVAADGSVKDVNVTEGDPLLAKTATEAVMQWKFEPFIQCGKPVEMQTQVHVQFPSTNKP
jgi:TonB family protein